MEHRYALFVAVATFEAHEVLSALLEKHRARTLPGRDVLTDVARSGIQRALARLFPGLPRVPFRSSPLEDVVLALRYAFEQDPEGLGSPAREESSRTARVPRGMGETQGVSSLSSVSVPKLPAAGPSDTQAGRGLPPPSSSHRLVPQGAELPPPAQPESSRFPTPPPPPESQQSITPVPLSAPATKLQRIAPAPIFPWERRRKPEGSGE